MRSFVLILLVATISMIGLVSAQCGGYQYWGDDGCGVNEVRASCGSVCEPTCVEPNPEFCTANCIPNGCRCMDGTVRDGDTNMCVNADCCVRH